MDINLLLIALWGGILSTTTPCNLLAIPSFISYALSETTSAKKGFMLSVFYGLGFCLVFTILGLCLLFIPGFIKNQTIIQTIAGGIIILLGLYLIIKKPKNKENKDTPLQGVPQKLTNPNNLGFKNERNINHLSKDEENLESKSSESNLFDGPVNINVEMRYWESFSLGLSFGTSGFSCALPIFTPVLTSIIAEGSTVGGIPYLFLYSFGIVIPYIFLGLFIGKINEKFLKKIGKYQKTIERIFGLIILILGFFYMQKGLVILGYW